MQAIVIAVDVSSEANPVVEALQNLHISPETTLVLAHVLAPVPSDIPADIPGKNSEPHEQILKAEQYLESQAKRIATTLGDEWNGVLEVEIASGDPAEEIVRLAGIYEADLIVLGSRGLAGMNRVILGSVSAQVVEQSRCSVYVVK